MPEARFEPRSLERLRDAREVEISTRARAGGAEHRAVIWVVVDTDGRVLVRSYRGPGARWYREALTGTGTAIVVDGTQLPVRVVGAADPERVASCSAELLTKYAGDPAARAMVRHEVLGTTLELVPA
jgi:hypothetical protein